MDNSWEDNIKNSFELFVLPIKSEGSVDAAVRLMCTHGKIDQTAGKR